MFALAWAWTADSVVTDIPAAPTLPAAPQTFAESGSTAPAFARYDFPLVSALVPSTGPVFEVVGTKKGSTVRSTCRSSAEDPNHSVSRARGGAACRVRSLEITHREFASELAAARSGFVAFRSDIPPPSLSV